jgi:hypothetical protein
MMNGMTLFEDFNTSLLVWTLEDVGHAVTLFTPGKRNCKLTLRHLLLKQILKSDEFVAATSRRNTQLPIAAAATEGQ